VSKSAESPKRAKTRALVVTNPKHTSTEVQGMSAETLKSLEIGLAMLKANIERLAGYTSNNWAATSEESASYIAIMMGVARSNTASAVDLVTDLAEVRNPSDLVAVANAHAQRQLDIILAQNRHLWASAQKLVNATLPAKLH
jgi:hypothetical protein